VRLRPPRIPIRPLAVAPPDNARRAPERAAGNWGARSAAMLLSCGLRRSDAAALAMDHVERRGGRRGIVACARPPAWASRRAAYGSHTFFVHLRKRIQHAWSVLPVSAVIELAAVTVFALNLGVTFLRPTALSKVALGGG
jgi:hypothetical protein